MKLQHALLVCVLATGLVACGDTSGAPLAPERPDFNGFTFGSGHRADSTSTTTAEGSTTERGIFTIGTGN